MWIKKTQKNVLGAEIPIANFWARNMHFFQQCFYFSEVIRSYSRTLHYTSQCVSALLTWKLFSIAKIQC